MTGSIDTLSVNHTETIVDSPIFGIGRITIKVKVTADDVSELMKTTNATVFVIFVMIR